MTDPETAAAVSAVARCLRDRDPGTDDEVFALELITVLRARGWRPTEAKPPPPWNQPRPAPGPDSYRQGLAELRRQLGGAA